MNHLVSFDADASIVVDHSFHGNQDALHASLSGLTASATYITDNDVLEWTCNATWKLLCC